MSRLYILFFFAIFISARLDGQSAIEIAKKGINSTVSIVVSDKNLQPLGYGSGFIIDDEFVATNVHVIEGGSSAYVLKNGEQKRYAVSGYVAIDRLNDIVILKVSELHGNKLPFGSMTFPEIGEKIYAIGNPKGLNGTFSEGIISGIRKIDSNQVLQITAPISPGSSGGPVLNSSGQVIGIAFGSFTSGQSLNFAIPIKYLSDLKNIIGISQSISLVKSKPQKPTVVTSSIIEGVVIRNIAFDHRYSVPPETLICYSIKNNLSNSVSDIRILVLVYDATGTVVDYEEKTYFQKSENREGGIKPLLAKSIAFPDAPEFIFKKGYRVQVRVLDFKIVEE